MAAPQVDIYTSTGANTWNKPASSVHASAIIIGAGGGCWIIVQCSAIDVTVSAIYIQALS